MGPTKRFRVCSECCQVATVVRGRAGDKSAVAGHRQNPRWLEQCMPHYPHPCGAEPQDQVYGCIRVTSREDTLLLKEGRSPKACRVTGGQRPSCVCLCSPSSTCQCQGAGSCLLKTPPLPGASRAPPLPTLAFVSTETMRLPAKGPGSEGAASLFRPWP